MNSTELWEKSHSTEVSTCTILVLLVAGEKVPLRCWSTLKISEGFPVSVVHVRKSDHLQKWYQAALLCLYTHLQVDCLPQVGHTIERSYLKQKELLGVYAFPRIAFFHKIGSKLKFNVK
jgi:hypothetical protein